ncbi:ATP-grasp domain-containing protein [Thermodesulfobacteriota bacterium]
MDKFNILLTSAGRRSYLVKYFKKALGSQGRILTANSVQPYPASYYSDVSLTVPYGFEPRFEEALIQIIVDHNIRMLFSLHDWEAPYIAAFSKKLKALGSIPVIAGPGILKICIDKYATAQFLQEKGLLFLKTYLTAEEALKAIARGEINFPLIIKPRYGQGSIDLFRVEDHRELTGLHELILRKTAKVGFGLFPEKDRLIIQELAQGTEYGLNVLNDLNGKFIKSFTIRKIAMRHGETDSAVVEDHPEILQIGQQLGKLLGHPGLLDVDVILTKKGPTVLELNPRFGGQYPFFHSAGVNIPRWLIAHGQGRPPSPTDLNYVQNQTFMKSIDILKIR